MPGSESEIKNAVMENSMNLLYSLSFYSPIIILISVLLFSIFTGSLAKASWYYLWIFAITFLRVILFKSTGYSDQTIPDICSTGLTALFIPKDATYSTYVLTFTMMYFFLPMVMVSNQSNVNVVNYGVLAFFIAYIFLDLFIKSSLNCIPSFFSKLVIGNVVGGLFLGGVVAGVIMYGSNLKGYLFINEVNTNKEVCSMPSKQQFKCSVYKNGELVGSSIN
jgi:hypothetical protein